MIAGGGRRDLMFGGRDADTFQFSASIADNGARDTAYIMDFDVTEDLIDLGGAQIARVVERFNQVWLSLEGDGDLIVLRGPRDFDDITFVDDMNIA